MISIVIYGTRGLTSTLSSGDYHCPNCGPSQYQLQSVRTWFALYFIPLIPMWEAGKYIECGQCGATWDEEVLNYNPEQIATAMNDHIRRILVLAAIANGRIEPAEIEAIGEIYAGFSGQELSEQQIAQEIEMARAGGDLVAYGREIADSLTEEGLEVVLQLTALIFLAKGEMDAFERQRLEELRQAIGGVTAQRLEEILAEIQEE